jgi:ATP-binding cassette subfamily B multidrug efflux pump
MLAMTSFQRFRKYLSPYWPWIVGGTVFIILMNCAKLAAPLILGQAVDDLKTEINQSKLLHYGGALILIALGQCLFLFLEQYMFIHILRSYEYEMRNDYYAHLQKLPVEFYQKYRTGDLMTRAMNDINVVRMQASAALMFMINSAFILTLLVPLMISIEWHLALLTFLLLPLIAVATRGFSKHIHHQAIKVQEYVGMIANRAQEALASIRITRAYTQEQAEIVRFTEVSREAVKRNLGLARLTSIYVPTLQLIVQMVSLLVLCYGGTLVVRSSLSIGQFVQFMLYTSLLVYPMIELGSIVSFFERARVSMDRINEVMSVEPVSCADRDSHRQSVGTGAIEFRNLTFTYKGATEPVLRDVNLRVEQGQIVGILGPVGSGKSTLMSLIPRVLEADAGQVLIDGDRIEGIPLAALRAGIGYVPQESFLFSESVADNISFGAEHATAEEIKQSAADAELARDIEGFPQGYETVLGERGITLSGGQKQRLAIARALIRRPRILLLDDALSAVDTYTEENILQNLRRIMSNCTGIVISHRVSTVKHADLILMMDEGRIVERGRHAELLKRGAQYAKLCERQALEEELVAS